MILSVSRRTDIPAFYSDWFFNRLTSGYLYVKNPMNRKQISQITLNPDIIDCIVFWTKNPEPMLSRLSEISKYNYYFQFTITPYDSLIEKIVPSVQRSIDIFQNLSSKVGPDRVIWRYDPIFLTEKFNLDCHIDIFSNIAKSLSGYTKRCVISFLDVYKKCERNMRQIQYELLNLDQIKLLCKNISSICRQFGIAIETCAEEIDLIEFGIKQGKCIDDELISKISKNYITVKKDNNQRDVCGCVSSVDIGNYNSCPHNCVYCYANFDTLRVSENIKLYNKDSELLCGQLIGDEKITIRKMESLFLKKQEGYIQGSLF